MATPSPASTAPPAPRPSPGSSARSCATSTTCCSSATGGLVAYGLWVLESVTRERRSRRSRLLRLPPDDLRRRRRPAPRRRGPSTRRLPARPLAALRPRHRPAHRRVRPRRGGARLEALDPDRLLQLPAVGAREDRPHRRARRLRRRAPAPADGVGTTLGVIGLAAPLMALVFKEPDFGTTLIYAAIVLGALFFGGTPWRHLAVLAIIAGLVAGALLWFLPSAGIEVLEPYQRERLTGFVDPDIDPSGSTYNVNQSITAVGSGGFDGRGADNATQTKFNYLPEHSTDFIFSSLAEQRASWAPRSCSSSTRSSSGAGRRSWPSRRPLLGDPRRDGRVRAPHPALHQRRDDDRDRARDRHPAAARLLRRQLAPDDAHPHRAARGGPRPRPPGGHPAAF